MSLTIAVTGSSGFLGRALMDAGARAGAAMVPIRLPRFTDTVVEEEIAGLLRPHALDALVHTAAVRHPRTPAERALNGHTPGVLAEVLKAGHPEAAFVHISTLNVLMPDLYDAYTVTKRHGELSLAGREGTIIVRPGLIWSMANEGDAGHLDRAVKLLWPVVPCPWPGPLFRPVLVEHMAGAIIGRLMRPASGPRVVNMFGDTAVSLYDLADRAARRHGKRVLRVPTGWIETVLPAPLRRRVPRLLRRIDYGAMAAPPGLQRGEDTILPFRLAGPNGAS